MTSTHYKDANLHQDLITSQAVTAILHMINATPVHQCCKRQLTVETATFGSELLLQGPLLIKLSISAQPSCTLVYPSIPKATCMEKIRQWLAMPTSQSQPSPKDPTLLHTIEFKKHLQQDISSSVGRLENPILQISLVAIGDLLVSGQFYNHCFSG